MARRRTLQGTFLAIAMATVSHAAIAASDAATGSGGVRASASIDLRIDVPRVMQMRLVGHPASITVTAEDVARGSIRVSGPAVDLLVNDRLGFSIRADLAASAFSAVKISGLAAPVVATQSGATIRMNSMVGRPKPAPVPVEYELQLAPGAQPGQYAWPVTLSLQQV